jgi:hypothetical protein
MTKEKKNVHILVPKGFQNKQLMRATKGISHDASDTPADGECLACKGTGAILHRVWLEDFHVVDHKIVSAKPCTAWTKCKCYLGAFWLRFHPLNVQAKLFPKWEKEIHEMLEREKTSIITACGGNYNPHQDSFLKDIGYKAPEHSQTTKTLRDMNFSGIVKT